MTGVLRPLANGIDTGRPGPRVDRLIRSTLVAASRSRGCASDANAATV